MEEQKTPTETEVNQKLADEFNSKREKFTLDMIMYRAIYEENTTNDHPFFLYLGSIMNYIENHNGGCLTDLGMKSLQLDISDFILHLQEGGFNRLHQKELVRFLLNILNSYAVCVLATGLLEFAKTNDTFFELNPFPSAIRDDFPALQEKALDLIPKLKQVLDAYTTYLEPKYRTIFNQEKTKGFVKQIFNDSVVKLGSKSFPMNDVAASKEMK